MKTATGEQLPFQNGADSASTRQDAACRFVAADGAHEFEKCQRRTRTAGLRGTGRLMIPLL